MKSAGRFALITGAVLSLAVVNGAAAQERSDEERRREAQARVEEARRDLDEAVRLLEQDDSDEARRRLEASIRALNRAMSGLDRTRARMFSLSPGQTPLLIGSREVKMGVYVSTARDRTTDSIGAELDGVVDGGPADEAGLRGGDIITHANGEALARAGRGGTSPGSRLIEIKNELSDGDTLQVRYRRGSETGTAAIIVRQMDNFSYGFNIPNIDVEMPRFSVEGTVPFMRVLGSPWMDVELVTLDDDLGAYFGTTEGLLVIRAPSDDSIDLMSGDVILNVDGREPNSQSHLFRILRSYEPGETMVLEVMRNRTRVNVTAEVPERDDGDVSFFYRRR